MVLVLSFVFIYSNKFAFKYDRVISNDLSLIDENDKYLKSQKNSNGWMDDG